MLQVLRILKFLLVLMAVNFTKTSYAQLPVLKETFQTATARTQGDLLTVSTGKMQRTWQWTGKGLVTVALKNLQTGKEWKAVKNPGADWAYYGLIDETQGKLITLTAKQDNDERFTSEFLKVTAEVDYPSVESSVRYEIWVYPNAPGIRTQLFIKGNGEKYLKNVLHKGQDKSISVALAKGKVVKNQKSALVDNQSVELLVVNLKPRREYIAGVSFSSDNLSTLSQKISASNIDRELKQVLIEDASADNQMVSFTSVVPAKLLADGSFRLNIEKVAGSGATLSEVWIYEKGEGAALNASSVRIKELQDKAPQGTFLAAYNDFSADMNTGVIEQFGRTDFLPVAPTGMTKRLIGYYNNTQNRNTPETPLIKEVVDNTAFKKAETFDWASILALEDKANGMMLVKESHKCVNQYGVETGDFEVNKEGVFNRGTSLYPKDITPGEYKWCWATWSIVFTAGEVNRQTALKEFDKIRYPIDPDRDIYIQANTWGSSRNREAADEVNILKELDIQAQLGIDIQQIDDGWQDKDWHPKKETYPQGWQNVVAKAKAKNVKLGLWGAAIPITLEALKYNYDHGKFVSYKLDFAFFDNHDKIDETIQKVRNFIKYTNHKVRINWDVTENAARFGYFWAREYGCVYLENRKPNVPLSVVYIPSLVLRDVWQLSKYTNIHKFQTTIQNVDRIDSSLSNAYLHNNPYAVAIGLIGTPLFFQETQFYKAGEIEKIKPVLDAYKSHRNEIYGNHTFPIGDVPNDASYTGFQNYREKGEEGYLFLFRELKNKEQLHSYKLEYIKNKQLQLTDILTGTKRITRVDDEGCISIGIDIPAHFKIYTFKILK